jgi:hypothetical protein
MRGVGQLPNDLEIEAITRVDAIQQLRNITEPQHRRS